MDTNYRIIKIKEPVDGHQAWLVRAMPGDTVGVVVRERPRRYHAMRYKKFYGSGRTIKAAAAVLIQADKTEPWR